MPVLLKEKTVVARKSHPCQTCDTTAIQKGETYKRETYVYDGRVYDWVQCVACAAIAQMVYEWSDGGEDGIGRDDYYSWAFEVSWEADAPAENPTPEIAAANAYLERIGRIVDHPWIGVSGHPDDPECANRSDGTDATYCGVVDYLHVHSTR